MTGARNAQIVQTGSTFTDPEQPPVSLLIGDENVAGSGNGLLLRVSDVQAPVVRAGISALAGQAALAKPPSLTVGQNAQIFADALTLDSTYGTRLDARALLLGENIALNSGQIILQFDRAGDVPEITGLTLSGRALHSLQSAESLSLLSYTSLDVYGQGRFSTTGNFALHAGAIRGFHTGTGSVTFSAPEILLDNSTGGSVANSNAALAGRLVFNAGTIHLGVGEIQLEQFSSVDLNASRGLRTEEIGSLNAQGRLNISTPLLTGASASSYAISTSGALAIRSAGGSAVRSLDGGLGAVLSLTGTSISANSNIALASGRLTLHATTGDLEIGNLSAALLDVGGTSRVFGDLVKYTSGGEISLVSDAGSVVLGAKSDLRVAAQPGGGDAGRLSISAPEGELSLLGRLAGGSGSLGESGTFSLDVNRLPNLTALDRVLNGAAFDLSRSFRVRAGDITLAGLASAHSYTLSADQGSITIADGGKIDASGRTGGQIHLIASGSVTLESGAALTAAAASFNAAGKGGAIALEAGAARAGASDPSGFVDLQAGSKIDLSVAAKTARSEQFGQFTGTLHLRAPQIGTEDLQVRALDGSIRGASSILVEGYKLWELTGNGVITSAVQNSVRENGLAFGENIPLISSRLLANNSALDPILVVAPGAEIINRTGNLTLGTSTSTSTATADWDLTEYRVGPRNAAGVLTLRAAGNLVFNNALSDGFTSSDYTAELLEENSSLPDNTESWSYRLTAGADLAAVDYRAVPPLTSLAASTGSLQLGKLVTTNSGNATASGGVNALTSTALRNRFQVIRTGSGDIEISTGRDVQLLNQFASIYTAGTRVNDPTLGGNFEAPPSVDPGTQGSLGANQQIPLYAAQYSLAGGNVTIHAQNDIVHQTILNGVLVADSEKQIPNNWLYRRGYVDPLTGRFAASIEDEQGTTANGSTSWWVDFSNFFEGVGTLGGGNVTLIAGNDVSNVDAVAPTNARMTFRSASGDQLASGQTLVELGGGDVTVHAGHNINAGIYYVERGQGTLSAGNVITTNSTRSASRSSLRIPADVNPSPDQWLPTTLFLGKGNFTVNAGGDLLLGPTVNPFLLPVGLNNSFWRKSYFSTYAATSSVSLASLGGSITLRQSSTAPAATNDAPILQNWMQAIHLLTSNPPSISFSQPWLRLAETTVAPFRTAMTILPGTIRATAFSGDLNLVGTFNLSPSPVGTLEFATAGAINGLRPSGITIRQAAGNVPFTNCTSATLNLSDADPGAIHGIYSPFANQIWAGVEAINNQRTANNLLLAIDSPVC